MFNILSALLGRAAWFTILFVPSQQTPTPPVDQIRVQIDGLPNDKGQLICALIASDMWLSKRTSLGEPPGEALRGVKASVICWKH
jgi:hypothetical protein